MIIAVDSTALALLVNPETTPPLDPATGEPVQQARERITKLVEDIERERGTIIIPTPSLAEVLVGVGDGAPAVLQKLNASARFKIAPFDQRAAIELAVMTREALASGNKRAASADPSAPWQKVKLDRQIIAIARANMATRIYSDDKNVGGFAERIGLEAVKTWTLPVPEQEINLFTAFDIDHNPGVGIPNRPRRALVLDEEE